MNSSNSKSTGGSHEPSPHVVPRGLTPCVWMEAGVLTLWMCDRDLQCSTCPLDAALHRPHHITNPHRQAPPPAAPKRRLPWSRLIDRELASLDTHAQYAPTHTWVREEGDGLVRVGLDAFAAWVVGRLRGLVLVRAGMRVTRGDPFAWLDQAGGTLTVTSPVSGDVVQSNDTLTLRGELELDDPFESNWLLLLRPSRLRTEMRWLVRAPQFGPMVARDTRAWRRLLCKAVRAGSARAGSTLADGGCAVSDLDELLGARRHNRIASRFLRASRWRR